MSRIILTDNQVRRALSGVNTPQVDAFFAEIGRGGTAEIRIVSNTTARPAPITTKSTGGPGYSHPVTVGQAIFPSRVDAYTKLGISAIRLQEMIDNGTAVLGKAVKHSKPVKRTCLFKHTGYESVNEASKATFKFDKRLNLTHKQQEQKHYRLVTAQIKNGQPGCGYT